MPLLFSTENERLVGVFGRAGPQSYYKQDKVNNISFVIFDAAKGTTRVEGVSTYPPVHTDVPDLIFDL